MSKKEKPPSLRLIKSGRDEQPRRVVPFQRTEVPDMHVVAGTDVFDSENPDRDGADATPSNLHKALLENAQNLSRESKNNYEMQMRTLTVGQLEAQLARTQDLEFRELLKSIIAEKTDF